jgi:glycosyltransferase involved in cell wall biosynthesis
MSKKRINILTPVPFWHPGTYELIEGLNKHNIEVVALDIWSFKYFDENQNVYNFTPKFLKGFALRLYKKLFRKKIIKKYIKKTDIVDIQWCGHYYAPYMSTIKNQGKKVHATLFGSDLFRTPKKDQPGQRIIFETADKIVMGVNMFDYFDNAFPGFKNKVHYTMYGSKRVDIINDLNTQENINLFKNNLDIPLNKIILTFGYNAKEEQQHNKFFEILKSLPEDFKSQLFLILPINYGTPKNSPYYNWLLQESKKLDIEFKTITTKLTNEELAQYRIVSDITVNIQTTDALSSSIKEAFVAGDILLVGNWLPYDLYENMGVFYIKQPLEKIGNELQTIISNYTELKEKCRTNPEKIVKFASWERIIPEFINIYYN